MLASPRLADADALTAPRTAITETIIAGVPWYLWCAALAVTSAYVGGYWDIAWHRSIGRDSFLSRPAPGDLRVRYLLASPPAT